MDSIDNSNNILYILHTFSLIRYRDNAGIIEVGLSPKARKLFNVKFSNTGIIINEPHSQQSMYDVYALSPYNFTYSTIEFFYPYFAFLF